MQRPAYLCILPMIKNIISRKEVNFNRCFVNKSLNLIVNYFGRYPLREKVMVVQRFNHVISKDVNSCT